MHHLEMHKNKKRRLREREMGKMEPGISTEPWLCEETNYPSLPPCIKKSY